MEIKYISKEKTIKVDKLPFKITRDVCKSYILLHFFDLEITDEILDKCCIIFNILLRYSSNYCIHNENIYHTMGLSTGFWISNRYPTPKDKFTVILQNFNLQFVCGSFVDFDLDGITTNLYTLFDMLTNTIKYSIFYKYFDDQYDYYDIYNAMKHVTNKYKVPLELIDEIIVLGF